MALYCEDILYRVQQYLPFVDRCELSLTCKDFQEARKDLLPRYIHIGHPQNDGCITGTLLTWLLTEHTLGGPCSISPLSLRSFRCDSKNIIKGVSLGGINVLDYIDATSSSDLHGVMYNYNTGRLHVKNWNALIERRAIVVPNIMSRPLGYDPREEKQWMDAVLSTMQGLIEHYARLGFTLIPYSEPSHVSDHFREIYAALSTMQGLIEHYARLGFTLIPYSEPSHVSDHFHEIYTLCLAQDYKPTPRQMIENGYSLARFRDKR